MQRSVHLLKSMNVGNAQAKIQAESVWLQKFHDNQGSPYPRKDHIKPPEKKSQG